MANDFVDKALAKAKELGEQARPLVDKAGERLKESADATAYQASAAAKDAARVAKPHLDAFLDRAKKAAADAVGSMKK